MGKAKKTRKLAAVKRVLNPKTLQPYVDGQRISPPPHTFPLQEAKATKKRRRQGGKACVRVAMPPAGGAMSIPLATQGKGVLSPIFPVQHPARTALPGPSRHQLYQLFNTQQGAHHNAHHKHKNTPHHAPPRPLYRLTLCRAWWTASMPSAFPVSLTVSWLSWRSWVKSIRLPSR